jgi:hypothetical protein
LSECTGKKYRDKLHAFELGMLSDSDRRLLEIHLLECKDCFDEARSMKESTELLRDDPDIKDAVKQISAGDKHVSESILHKVKRLLWPADSKFAFVKPVTAIILLIIIAYPVYRLGFYKPSEFRQTINLFPMRAEGQNILLLEMGGDVVINFVYEDAIPGNIYNIIITSRDGEIIYSNKKFDNFNDSGMGSTILPVNKFKPGDYILEISDPSFDRTFDRFIYYFKAE